MAQRERQIRRRFAAGWLQYVWSIALVAAVTLIGQAILPFVQPTSNLVMLYLLPVVISALYWGRVPSVVTSISSILAYRFLFVPRLLPPSLVDDYLMFLTVLMVGLVVSTLATQAREQAGIARQATEQTMALYALSRDLAAAGDLDSIVQASISRIGTACAGDVAILLSRNDELMPVAATWEVIADDKEHQAALWALHHAQAAGRGSGTLEQAQALYVPMSTSRQTLGVLAVRPIGDVPLLAEQKTLVKVFASLVAMAIERVQLAEDAHRADLNQAKEKLQTALLHSISHDLRTPLSSITGSLTSLLDANINLDEATRRDLLETAWQQAEHLNHLVANLLDMSRLEAGAMQPVIEPCDLQDLVGAALGQLGDRLTDRNITVDIADDIPSVPMDFALMTQVLVNLLDNAVKYSPPHTPIAIGARITDGWACIDVADRGIGIADEDMPHIFDRFYRARQQCGDGSGLGLAISKGIVELHGGRITAAHRHGGGTIFSIELPCQPVQPSSREEYT